MKRPIYLIFFILVVIFIAKAQTHRVIVNPDGTHSVIIDNGNSSTIVNPDGSHSTVINHGSTSTIVNPNGTHSTIYNNGSTSTIVNPDGTYSVIINNGNISVLVHPDGSHSILQNDSTTTIVNTLTTTEATKNGYKKSDITISDKTDSISINITNTEENRVPHAADSIWLKRQIRTVSSDTLTNSSVHNKKSVGSIRKQPSQKKQ